MFFHFSAEFCHTWIRVNQPTSFVIVAEPVLRNVAKSTRNISPNMHCCLHQERQKRQNYKNYKTAYYKRHTTNSRQQNSKTANYKTTKQQNNKTAKQRTGITKITKPASRHQ